MIFLKKILMTTDLSQYSLAALEYASSLGLLYASKVFLLYVVESGKDAAAGRAALAEFMQRNIGSEISLVPVVRHGHPVIEIKQFAEQEDVDLIVMATHGRTGVRQLFMGSVAEKVVRLSSVPVLTVKPRPIRESILDDTDIEKELHLR
jgi:nucleotide-binding universal stress UspA family protein